MCVCVCVCVCVESLLGSVDRNERRATLTNLDTVTLKSHDDREGGVADRDNAMDGGRGPGYTVAVDLEFSFANTSERGQR